MKADILIDWLTFTIKGMNADSVITDILNMDTALFEYEKKSINFYTSMKTYNNIRVLYDGHRGVIVDMGVCVTMSGYGCRIYEEHNNEDVLELIRRIINTKNTNITRIDIACDDKGGVLDMNAIWKFAQEDNYRSRMRAKNFYESFNNKKSGAKSVYFGSASSLCKIRIYDKSAQMYSPNSPLFGVHWIRFEIVLKNVYALQTAYILAESDDIESSVSGIINEKFCFIDRNDSNISRCKPCKWWCDFLENLDYVKLEAKPKTKHTVESHADWIEFAVSRVFAKVFKAMGSEKLNQILKSGTDKLKDSDIAQIEDYQRRFGDGL